MRPREKSIILSLNDKCTIVRLRRKSTILRLRRKWRRSTILRLRRKWRKSSILRLRRQGKISTILTLRKKGIKSIIPRQRRISATLRLMRNSTILILETKGTNPETEETGENVATFQLRNGAHSLWHHSTNISKHLQA